MTSLSLINLESNLREVGKKPLGVLQMRVTKMSVMPCRLNIDVHEWFNEVVTVPSWCLLNLFRGEKATDA